MNLVFRYISEVGWKLPDSGVGMEINVRFSIIKGKAVSDTYF